MRRGPSRHHRKGRCRRLDLHLAAGELEAAIGTCRERNRKNGVTFRADLGRRLARARLARLFGFHQIDRAVTGDVAGEIQHQTIFLARRETRPAPGHLDVKPRRLGRTQHGDEVDARGVEARRQHTHGRQSADFAPLEGVDDLVALVLRRRAEDRGAGQPAATHFLGHMCRVVDAGAEQQPGLAIRPVGDDLIDGGTGDRLLVDRRLQLAGDIFAATCADAGDVEPGLGALADQRAKIALVDQVAHRHIESDVREQRVLALM